MIPKSGYRFSEKIMLQQQAKAGWRIEEKSSRFRHFPAGGDATLSINRCGNTSMCDTRPSLRH
jgi:hypothetical protein